MNLIEEAAKRLQQLEQAGVALPGEPEARARESHEQRRSPDPLPQLVSRAAEASARLYMPSADRTDNRTERALPDDAPRGRNFCTIDLASLQAAGFITPAVTDSRLLHEFRVLKRPLIQNALEKSAKPLASGNLIMVTSPLPREGKTFVALNLAMSIALEVDCTVLLVDADVAAPSIPQHLGIQPAKGLLDVLTDPVLGFGDVLLRTNVERLALVLAGTPHRQASELLASDSMARLLSEVSSRYPDRIVVFDSPPLLATTESRVLARHMGQVVVVVEAERTTHGALESALSTLEPSSVVLTVLNKVTESDVATYYGYYGREGMA